MAARFAGKVAIITGGAGNIGREHSLLFAGEGAKVLVNDIGIGDVGENLHSDAGRVVAEIEAAGGTAVASREPASSFAGAARVVEQALDEFGRVDILINNATAVTGNDLWRFSEEEWDLGFDVNLKGYFAMIKYVTPHFAAQRSGVIVNTSSGSGFGHPSNVAYASAKEGLLGLTRTAAKELGRFGIRCNAIRPSASSFGVTHSYLERSARWTGLIDLTMDSSGGAQSERLRHDRADPDLRAPRKVSPFVAWLCSDAARNVNGRTFRVVGDMIGLYSEPVVERAIYQQGGWTLGSLDLVAPQITNELRNDFTLDDHPEWQLFEE